jgi:hypothetical protein
MTSIRKGNKKLAIYELKITMKWEAQAEDDAEQVCSGKAGLMGVAAIASATSA